jgi:hypothetical protein
MPRILSDQPCNVTFSDNISGDKITVEYRMPTSEERIKYANSQISRHGGKITSTTGETRQKYGMRILTGIADGSFVKGDGKPLSSNPQSPDYDPAWKAIVIKYASDVISQLAMHVFENALMDEELDMEIAGDEGNPT